MQYRLIKDLRDEKRVREGDRKTHESGFLGKYRRLNEQIRLEDGGLVGRLDPWVQRVSVSTKPTSALGRGIA